MWSIKNGPQFRKSRKFARLTTSQRALLYFTRSLGFGPAPGISLVWRLECLAPALRFAAIAGMVHAGAGGAVADLAPELEGFCPEIDKFGALARAALSAWFIILEGLMVSPALARKSPQRLLLENASERTTAPPKNINFLPRGAGLNSASLAFCSALECVRQKYVCAYSMCGGYLWPKLYIMTSREKHTACHTVLLGQICSF